MKDVKLLRLLHKDSNRGMEQLINEYAGLVYAVVNSRLISCGFTAQDVEECVSDVFSEFYLDVLRYDPKLSSIKTYLCVLARNNAIDYLRKNKKHCNNVSIDEQGNNLHISDDITVESTLEESELHKEVFTAIKKLGEPDTSIIIYKYLLGKSSKEIAALLKLTVSNVDTRTHRALSKLRKMFGGENE